MVKTHGNRKIGIVGASTTGTLALTAASYFEDLTLTIGLTPSDFIWQGFMQGKKMGVKNGRLRENHFSLIKENRFRICRFAINIRTTGM